MHAFLLVGNNSEQEINSRIAGWKISSWDITRIPQEGTVGIDLVRDFQRKLSLTPRNSPAKVGVVTDMERLTVEAQNALLKTLEEPPPHTYIIGTTAIPEALLPTIRSRMSVIQLAGMSQKIDTSLLTELMNQPVGKRLQTVETYAANRDDAKKLVSELLAAAHQEMLARPSIELASLIRNLLTAITQLSVNVNQKLVVDNIFLSIP
jgi:DNA polymerase III delta prime subunit